ncbi:hypothetical protein OPV22_033109 [Ensete ventricosum]|uniref:Uncharacterized protein n=1 Tax=Ensete ventricosum TaxID=4639 RepID=A0AAV8PTF8_ENSVE|nr:hypothetical protein OPV22_033109 [Ensete ventricosum]
MPRAADAIHDDGGSVKIGATGTIGTLMTRELESQKHSEQVSSTQRKQQTVPVSIPCGANPRRALQRRNQTDEHGSTRRSSGGSNSEQAHCANHARRNGHRTPMLRYDDSPVNRTMDTDRVGKKAYTVEIVDLKCSSPLSSQLKKLGFSKLSVSTS